MTSHDRQQHIIKQIAPIAQITQIAKQLQPHWAQLRKRSRSRLGWLMAGLAIGLGGSTLVAIITSPQAEGVTERPHTQAAVVAAADARVAAPPLADGIYLYGESPEPEQLGRTYLVFEVTQGAVIGAFYMPSSEFDCTYGRLQTDQLALTVIDSYGQGRHPYAIALAPPSPIAAQTPTAARGLNLEGYYPLATVSENDRRMLEVCKAAYPISERTP